MSTRTRRPRIREPKISDLKRRLLEKCAFTRDTLQFKKAATPEELSNYWPGGAENADLSIEGWIFCHANYTRFCDRLDDGGPARTSAASTADSEVLKALSDAPVTVQLESVNGETPAHVAVYPKSFVALDFIDKRDHHIGWLTEQRKKLLDLPSAISADALEAVALEMQYQYGLVALAATHPAPGLPFDATEPAATLPAWISDLSPVDIIRIHKGFVDCNVVRLMALYALVNVQPKGAANSRPAWTTFFSVRAQESNLPSEVLMRDRSLCSQIATAMLAADVRNRTVEEAKNQSPESE